MKAFIFMVSWVRLRPSYHSSSFSSSANIHFYFLNEFNYDSILPTICKHCIYILPGSGHISWLRLLEYYAIWTDDEPYYLLICFTQMNISENEVSYCSRYRYNKDHLIVLLELSMVTSYIELSN